MMKLYYSAGSCSTSCHITLEESGLPYQAIEVDWDNANDPNLSVVAKLNPLGTLPVLITEDGKQLDQNLSIHAYVAEKSGKKNLWPQDSLGKAEQLNWLSFVCSDLHKSIGGIFSIAAMSQDTNVQSLVRKYMVEKSNEYLKYLDSRLSGRNYICGAEFTPVDAYAFVVVGWTKWVDISLTPYKNIEAFMGRMASRPAVQKVLKEEGLV